MSVCVYLQYVHISLCISETACKYEYVVPLFGVALNQTCIVVVVVVVVMKTIWLVSRVFIQQVLLYLDKYILTLSGLKEREKERDRDRDRKRQINRERNKNRQTDRQN